MPEENKPRTSIKPHRLEKFLSNFLQSMLELEPETHEERLKTREEQFFILGLTTALAYTCGKHAEANQNLYLKECLEDLSTAAQMNRERHPLNELTRYGETSEQAHADEIEACAINAELISTIKGKLVQAFESNASPDRETDDIFNAIAYVMKEDPTGEQFRHSELQRLLEKVRRGTAKEAQIHFDDFTLRIERNREQDAGRNRR